MEKAINAVNVLADAVTAYQNRIMTNASFFLSFGGVPVEKIELDQAAKLAAYTCLLTR